MVRSQKSPRSQRPYKESHTFFREAPSQAQTGLEVARDFKDEDRLHTEVAFLDEKD
jgi:hypothetical protein